jgi:hypothetical protein
MAIFGLLFWLILALLVGYFASTKGRSFLVFTLISLFFSPLAGFVIVLIMGEDPFKAEAKTLKSGESRTCPKCAELIKSQATICKHCNSEIPALSLEEIKGESGRTNKPFYNAFAKYMVIMIVVGAVFRRFFSFSYPLESIIIAVIGCILISKFHTLSKTYQGPNNVRYGLMACLVLTSTFMSFPTLFF